MDLDLLVYKEIDIEGLTYISRGRFGGACGLAVTSLGE